MVVGKQLLMNALALPAHYLSERPKWCQVVFGLVLVGLVWLIDYFTGTNPLHLIIYLIPIFITAWFAGVRASFFIALTSCVIWILTDLLSNHHYFDSTAHWHLAFVLIIYLILSYVVAALLFAKRRQDELTRFIVHDLRSPLANMVSGLQLLRRSRPVEWGASEPELIDISLASADRMLTLTDALLNLSRLEHDELPLKRDTIEVNELTELALQQVSLWARQKNVSLSPKVETAAAIIADKSMTLSILANLLSNALKFSPAGSTITLRACLADNRHLAFSITDQGPGIAPQWVKRVFDKFIQVDAHSAAGVIGSGLGLTFCKLATQAQGGRIWLDSTLGKGTTVTFTLPLAAPDQTTAPKHPSLDKIIHFPTHRARKV